MSRITEVWRRLRSVSRRARVEDGLQEELRFHLEQQTAKNLRAGMSPDAARRRALVSFGGGLERTREQVRDEFRVALLEDFGRDLRYAARSLGRAPAFVIVAILTLGMGIGATTTVFSVVKGVLLDPLPYPDADALVDLRHVAPGLNLPVDLPNSATQLFSYEDHSRTLQQIGFWTPTTVTVAHETDPELVSGILVSAGTLPALGVPTAIGRWFSREDDASGSVETVILSDGYWQRRFAGDPSVVGQTLLIDSRPRQIVGVMPRDFRFLDVDADLFLPFRFDRTQLALGEFNYQGLARLAPGATIAEANADIARIVPMWLEEWPSQPGVRPAMLRDAGIAPALRPLEAVVTGNISHALWIVMAAVGLVLVIACANVANLSLVRAETRHHETALRIALGAGRRRIATAALAESLILAVASGACGVILAVAGIRWLVAAEPDGLPRLGKIGFDPVVLLFAAGISMASALAFGLLPAMRRDPRRLAGDLRSGGRSLTEGRERRRLRRGLVVTQVALATVLLVGSGLLVRTFVALTDIEPGFVDPGRVQTVRVTVPPNRVSDPEEVFRLQMDIRNRLAALPGVTMAAFANSAPMQGSNSHHVLHIEGRSLPDGAVPEVRRVRFISPGFLATLGTPLVAGRDLEWTDIHAHRPVAVVSAGFARETWGSPGAALGRRVRDAESSTWREIVGVTADVHDDGVDRPAPSILYLPVFLTGFRSADVQATRSVTFVLRSEQAGTERLIGGIREAVRAATGGVPIDDVTTLGQIYDRSLARRSFALVVLALAASVAVLLAVVGLYGVLSYAVTQRSRDIGIRSALGASHTGLRRVFVREGLLLTAVGIAVGAIAAGGLTSAMSSLLFGVGRLDPMTYGCVAGALAAAAALASYIPARRATKVNPVEVLRS